MSRLNRTILILLLIVGIPYYWYFLDNSGPEAKAQPIDMAQLRELASRQQPGPARIRFEQIGSYNRVGNRIAAGSGLRGVQLNILAYLLEYEDGKSVLIGGGITRSSAKALELEAYSPQAQARVVTALAHADKLVPLVPSPDQLGGLHMLEGSEQARLLSADFAKQQQADANGEAYPVAPGIVVMPTPGLNSGARLVFVRMAGGKEFLFAGDLAQINQSWSELRLPARFTTDFGKLEDRGAIRSWLLTLRALKQQAPGLIVVSGNKIPQGGGFIRYFDESANIITEASEHKSRWSFQRDWSTARGNVPPARPRQDRHS